MTDGHTKEGSWKLWVEITEDQAQQIVRTMNWLKQMDSHEDLPPDFPQRLDYMANRVFIQEILEIFCNAIKDQRPELVP